MTNKSENKQLLRRQEAADYIGKSKSTLETWAMTGKNLRYGIQGNRAYYAKSDLDEYLKDLQSF